ncbi:MAG: hypothetical protein RM022_031025 [Nostoc sp. EfeVER01]|uniref:hypothetical protein n=1 Tax=unclassified Nostoc TaxID=2593658 RepID=UPI002AD34935|nr:MULTISPECIES: hypothetical protein [unclassified Nostoc]MDZ7943834.1 hypothetical protein [Nostoc sp. EfeVER01]MDZ7992035.1 hypothetical protein [Nostoc sp. EspVER01]
MLLTDATNAIALCKVGDRFLLGTGDWGLAIAPKTLYPALKQAFQGNGNAKAWVESHQLATSLESR